MKKINESKTTNSYKNLYKTIDEAINVSIGLKKLYVNNKLVN